jgi:hypothetical protein
LFWFISVLSVVFVKTKIFYGPFNSCMGHLHRITKLYVSNGPWPLPVCIKRPMAPACIDWEKQGPWAVWLQAGAIGRLIHTGRGHGPFDAYRQGPWAVWYIGNDYGPLRPHHHNIQWAISA